LFIYVVLGRIALAESKELINSSVDLMEKAAVKIPGRTDGIQKTPALMGADHCGGAANGPGV
jgi:hypothetical protein